MDGGSPAARERPHAVLENKADVSLRDRARTQPHVLQTCPNEMLKIVI